MRYKCEDCGANRGLAKYSSGDWCFSCNKYFKNKKLIDLSFNKKLDEVSLSDNFPINAINWLAQYQIFKNDFKNNNLKWCNNYKRICFCFGKDLTNYYLRSIIPNERNKWILKSERKEFYTKQGVSTSNLIIVEDPLSAIKVFSSKLCDVVALGGTNFNSSILVSIFLKYDNLVLWLDGDSPGRIASNKFRQKFKLLKPIKIINTKKDPKDHSYEQIEEILNEKICS
jgi:hypothetical protein